MRIIHSLEGLSWSGGQQQALFLAGEQANRGHNVLLMCQLGSELEQRAKHAGLQVRAHDYRGEMNPISIWGLVRAYDHFKPQIVNVHRAWAHTQWVLAALLRRFHGLVVSRRVLFRPEKNPLSTVKYRTPAVRGYLAVSRAVAARLSEVGVSSKKIKVVYSATDTNRFSPDTTHSLDGAWPVPNGKPAALLVGNFHPNKGHLLLLEAFSAVHESWPDLHLVLVGTGTNCEKLTAIKAQHTAGDNIHLLGFRQDVPGLLARSAFSINASYQEGFAGTIRESLAMNVPVVASNIPANLEMNELVPLILFESGKPDALAKGILQMKSKSSSGTLREVAEKKFSISTMVDQTLLAYQEFLRHDWANPR